MKNSVTTVLVTWNSDELLVTQLSTLTQFVKTCIVVDNGSTAISDVITTQFPQVKFVRPIRNIGYAAACNMGLQQSQTKWTLFLNPDVLLTEQALEQLITFCVEGSYTATTINTTEQGYSKPVPTAFSLLAEFSPLKSFVPQQFFGTKTLIGGIVLIDTITLKKLGGWDERFFLWFEDSDLTKRLQDAGHTIGFCDIPVEHIGGYSLKKLPKQVQRDIFFHGMRVYAKKHFTELGQWLVHALTRRFSTRKLLPEINQGTISVVVPNVQEKLLHSFLKRNYQYLPAECELIVVSSALTEETVWQFRKKYPMARFIPVTKNKGFANTVNIGFQAATGSYITTCNDDVELTSTTIAMLKKQVTPEIGSINPIILTPQGKIESAGISIQSKGKAVPMNSLPPDLVTEVDATNAACVLYTKEALNAVGIYDERFGSYLEDIDLSLRLRRNGYKNIVTNAATVIHKGHQTTRAINYNKSFHDFKNWFFVIAKNWSPTKLFVNLPAITIERMRNFSGFIKAKPIVGFYLLIASIVALFFVFSRLYRIETSLLFFNDIGRDFLVLFRWQETGKPPLLGPQTSALPYNQTAFYFYLLYPAYILTAHSPFSTIYTAVLFYVSVWLGGLWYLRNHSQLLKSYIWCWVIFLIHPMFIEQTRFVWNPTFVGPLALLSFYAFELFRQRQRLIDLLLFSLTISLAVSLNYSAAPLLLAFCLLAPVLLSSWKSVRLLWFATTAGLALWNVPTLAFELRHNFVLTNLLITGEKLDQLSVTIIKKSIDLLTYLFPALSVQHLTILAIGTVLAAVMRLHLFNKRKSMNSSLYSSLLLLAATVAITFLIPISVQAHYIFAILSIVCVVLTLLGWKYMVFFLLVTATVWLHPYRVIRYFSPAYRSVAETQHCAQLVCSRHPQPLFVSVQSGLHPYHNGMEFKYLFSEAGCTIKELDTQISEANRMAVVVDHASYTHGKTSYNELTQFGPAQVIDQLTCSPELQVVFIEKVVPAQ